MSGTAVSSVLLVEPDEAVIKDVVCSLRLIDIPVSSARTIEEAFEIAQKKLPTLILTRTKIATDDQAGQKLVEKLRQDLGLQSLPVYALCTSSELDMLGEVRGLFTGVVPLPVEFPAFPEQIKKIVDFDATSHTITEPAQAVLAQVERQEIPETASDKPVDIEIKDRNFSVAYAIQSRVLQELESDGRIHHARLEQVPGIVNQVTARVCVRYTTDKNL